jgi:hypothetical protein
VDDYAGALFDHGRYERTIQTHSGEQVLIERRVPLLIVEYRKTSGRSRRAADDVHNDVHAAEMLADGISDGGASFGCGNVSGNKLPGSLNVFWTRPGRGQNGDAGIV